MLDSLEGRLYLARDRYGIKPRYWRMVSRGSLIFASEVRPLVHAAVGVRVRGSAKSFFDGGSGGDTPPMHG